MKVGLQVVRFDWPGSPENIGPKLAEIARAAEQAGFDSFWVMDHYFQIAGRLGAVEDPMLEAYSALSYAAAVTQRIKLGVMVAGVIYRHPGFIVKAATTLDVLSGGRAIFGIGAAWYEREAKALGFPYPSTSERFEQLEETLQIAKRLWSGDFTKFEGKHFQLDEPINSPQPISQPHPPILIGGGGEKKTLLMVAQYGDACNLFVGSEKESVVHKLEVLQRHCEALGRPYEEIEKTLLTRVNLTDGGSSPAEVIDQAAWTADIGFDHFIFNLDDVHELQHIETFRQDIMPAIHEL
jgi:F420-dependent oxidoreductase-like protein